MNTITITLDTFDFRRAGHVMRVEPDLLNADIVTQLVYHGITQKVGDAAAGKEGDDALNAMQAVYDALCEGNWGRARQTGEPAIMAFIRKVIAANLSKDNQKLYDDTPKDERDAFLNGLWDGVENADTRAAIESRAQTKLDEHRAEQARRKAAKLADKVDIAI